ncbi:hypothetical protein, partial [Posidoniimonas corsicana]|uniref:hypothetical protein n=1 Tax=Posidoniimonas corsicana TaxID=1938618 RepID=UPI001E5BF7DE
LRDHLFWTVLLTLRHPSTSSKVMSSTPGIIPNGVDLFEGAGSVPSRLDNLGRQFVLAIQDRQQQRRHALLQF